MLRTPLDALDFHEAGTYEINGYRYTVELITLRNKRDTNEDAAICFRHVDTLVLAVCDGLGGHANGELASKAVVDVIETLTCTDSTGIQEILSACKAELDKASDNRDSTMTLCLINGNKVTYWQIGDSRAFTSEGDITPRQGYGWVVLSTVRYPAQIDSGTWEMQDNYSLVLTTDGMDCFTHQGITDQLKSWNIATVAERALEDATDNITAFHVKATRC